MPHPLHRLLRAFRPALLLVMLLAAPNAGEPPLPLVEAVEADPHFAGLAQQVEGWVRQGELLGAELLILHQGRPALHQAVGWIQTEGGEALPLGRLYRLRSMTKPFVGVLVRILAEEGRLSLDDPVSAHLAGWGGPTAGGVTLRQLLSQSAGFSREAFPRPFSDYGSLQAAVSDLGRVGPQGPPGAFAYSDANTAVLAAVAESALGRPIEELLQTRIFDPLSLRDTRCSTAPDRPWVGELLPTLGRAGPGRPWRAFWRPGQAPRFGWFRGSGGMVGTAADQAHWMQVVVDQGAFVGGRLLSPVAIQEALRPSSSPDYGQHWQLFSPVPDPAGLPAFGHSGSDGTLAMAVPEAGLVVVLLSQSRGSSIWGEWVGSVLSLGQRLSSDLYSHD